MVGFEYFNCAACCYLDTSACMCILFLRYGELVIYVVALIVTVILIAQIIILFLSTSTHMYTHKQMYKRQPLFVYNVFQLFYNH